MEQKKVTFPLPDGFSVPEGTEPGGEFDAVCTFRMEKDGKVCLTMMGDAKMPGYDDKSGRQVKQDYSGYAQSIQSAGPQMMGNNNASPTY